MPTTTNYGWTTPADTDLVKDGASAIRTLGTAIDTTVFNNASAAIAKTIVDAKGDLIVATAADTVARLASSATNGDLLTVDTSTASGLKWATPSGGITSATATVETSENTSSGSYTNLTTSGPAVTVTTGTKALVIVGAKLNTSADNTGLMSFEVSGATTSAAADTNALALYKTGGAGLTVTASRASSVTLTAGSNTFTAKYKAVGDNCTFSNRTIFVMNL